MDSCSQLNNDEQGNTVHVEPVDNLHFVSLCPSNGNLPLDISNELTDDINQNVRYGETPNESDSCTLQKNTNTNKRAILLGRGNSFTQGRSEAIFLNNAKQNQLGNSHVVTNGLEDIYTSHGSAPPPISKCVATGQTTTTTDRSGDSFDELEKLWHKVESIMLAKQEVVQQVLEEYGIGEAGDEDESVWQVLQDNFQV